MLLLRKPTTETIRAFLEAQGRLDLTYRAVGATATHPPAGFVVDHTRIRLGDGGAVFAAARSALERWDQFRLGWVEARPGDTPIREGEAVAVLARSFGLWWLNACRIVAVFGDQGAVSRFGFAYGTLPDHIGTGEERFLVEWDREGGGVWYDNPGLLPAPAGARPTRLPADAKEATAVRAGVRRRHAPGGRRLGVTHRIARRD